VLPPERVHWCRRYPSVLIAGQVSYFLAARIGEAEIAAIRFGDEGQYWRMMAVTEFLAHPEAIGHLQQRFSEYLAARRPG
jgi:8-oxo-dGTP diphosphatase